MMLNGAKRNKPIKGGRASPIGGINEDVRKKNPIAGGGWFYAAWYGAIGVQEGHVVVPKRLGFGPLA